MNGVSSVDWVFEPLNPQGYDPERQALAPGYWIERMILDAAEKDLLRRGLDISSRFGYEFRYNQVIIRVLGDSDPEEILQQYELALRDPFDKIIGPYDS